MRRLTVMAACLLSIPFAAHAQVDYSTATLKGTVIDPQGAVVPGATVTVTDWEKDIKRQTHTDNAGQYSVIVPAPAKYDVDVLKYGFQISIQKGIVINVGQTTTLDFHMKASQAVESVEVTTEPPAVDKPSSGAAPSGVPPVTVPVIRGFVLPRDVSAGQEISGLVVPDPERYENIPGLQVVPLSHTGTLEGMVIDVGDGRRQPANKPLTVKVPEQAAPLLINIFLPSQPAQPIAQGKLPIQSAVKMPPSTSAPGPVLCTMPPIATPGGIQVIHEAHNHTSGDSTAMRVNVDDKPATIVAAKPGTIFWQVPETLTAGPHQVSFTPGPGEVPINMQMRVVNLQMSAAKTALVRGESTSMTVTITGLEGLPASAWQPAAPPADLVKMESLYQRAKSFHPPKPQERGTVLLLLVNQSPAQIRMGKEGGQIVLQLHQKDFAQGPYIYQDRLQSLSSGGFSISGTLVAFLKDVEAGE